MSALCAGYVNRYLCVCADQKTTWGIKVDRSNTSHPDAAVAVVMKEGSSWMRKSSDRVPL